MRIEESNFEGKLQEYHVFDFGTIYFFDNIVVSEINEGVVFSYQTALSVFEFAKEHYHPEQKIVYLSNRINSYSVKPTDWIKVNNKFQNLIGIGIVHYNNFYKSIFNIEKLFSKREFRGFDNLDEALYWAEDLAKKSKIEIS